MSKTKGVKMTIYKARLDKLPESIFTVLPPEYFILDKDHEDEFYQNLGEVIDKLSTHDRVMIDVGTIERMFRQ